MGHTYEGKWSSRTVRVPWVWHCDIGSNDCVLCKRAYRAACSAQAFVAGLAEADLDWTGIHVLRALLKAASYARFLVYNKARCAKRRAEDPEGTRKSRREWMRAERAANPEKVRARARANYAANPAMRERIKAAAKAWKKANPLAKQADRLKYARRKAEAPGNFTGADVLAQYNAQAGLCFYCIRSMAEMHIEHKVPLSRGGTNWPDNIVCACAPCNLRKGTKTSAEFLLIVQGEMAANDRRAA